MRSAGGGPAGLAHSRARTTEGCVADACAQFGSRSSLDSAYRRSQPRNDPRNAGGIKNVGTPSRNTVPSSSDVTVNAASATSEAVPVAITMTPPAPNQMGIRACPAWIPSQTRSDWGHHEGRLAIVQAIDRCHDFTNASVVNKTRKANRMTSSIVTSEYRRGRLGPQPSRLRERPLTRDLGLGTYVARADSTPAVSPRYAPHALQRHLPHAWPTVSSQKRGSELQKGPYGTSWRYSAGPLASKQSLSFPR